MALKHEVRDLIDAAFSGIWVQTVEPDEAIRELGEAFKKLEYTWGTWDFVRGFALNGVPNLAQDTTDPIAAINAMRNLAPDGEDRETKAAVMIIRNAHHLFTNDGAAMIITTLEHAIREGKQYRVFFLLLSHSLKIPDELQKIVTTVNHDLPSRDDLAEILKEMKLHDDELPADDLPHILDAAVGLTRTQSENTFSLSIVKHKKVTPSTIWEMKAEELKKSGLMELYRGKETFADLGGLDHVKEFCKSAVTTKSKVAQARGIVLLGVPGSGKSAFAKALGNEVGHPTISLDFGALLGGLVGESEANIRRAISIIDKMEPCIVYVDEIEKGLAGVESSGQTDSGVKAGMFGTLLTWLNYHTSNVFFIATANDITKLPPEFTRAERFDAVFFVDLPGANQKKIIWDLYLKRFEIKEQNLPNDENWTGAEIRSCCRLAALLDVPLAHAALNVVPVAVTAREKVTNLRNWATDRCLDSERVGRYGNVPDAVKEGQPTARRAIRRDKNSNN